MISAPLLYLSIVMRRYLISFAFAAAAAPVPAQRVDIPGPDTVTIAPDTPIVLAPRAYDTINRYTPRARFSCEAVAPLAVRGDTLELTADGLDGLYVVRCTWLRSDGGRPSDSVFVRSDTPQLPPVVVPPPDTTPATLVARFVWDCTGLVCLFDRTMSTRPPENGLVTRWNFGDGTTGSVSRETHTYAQSGSYIVRLTITHALYPADTSVMVDTVPVVGTPPPPPDTTSAPPPPPPPPSGGSNEPAGFRVLTDRDFTSKAKANDDRGPTGSQGWDGIEYRYPKFSIVADASAPTGDGLVGQMFYPAAHQSGTAPGTAQTLVATWAPAPTQLYVSIWAKISSNWVGNQSGTNKMFFLGAGSGNNQFFLSAEGQGTGPLVPQLRLQGVLDPRARIIPNVAPGTRLTRGAWHRWEFLLTCNSGLNRSDGSITFWLDGVLTTRVTDVNWTQGKHPDRLCDFPIFNWNPTYGGGGASPGVDQYLRFDHVYVSGR
jgi:PKD repeat protein